MSSTSNSAPPSPDESSPFITSLAHSASDPFRLLVESIVDYAIYVIDPAGRIASWNPASARIYGYRAEEVIGRHYTIMYVPEDVARGVADEAWKRARADGHYAFDCLRVRKDGSRFWATVSVSNLNDHFGQHAGFSIVTRDITERMTTEAAIRREHDLSTAVLASLPGVYYMYDESGHFLRWNAQFEVASGYTATEIASLHPLDLFDGSCRERVASAIADVFRTGRGEVEAELLSKSGTRTAYYFNGVRAVIADQPCLLGMGIDITEHKRAEERLEQSRALLRVASRVGRLGAWSVELASLTVTWSEDLLAILELPPDHCPNFQFGIDIYLPEYRETVRAAFTNCVESGTPFDLEVESQTATGRHLWVRVIGEATRGDDGAIVGARGGFQDITERKRSAEMLHLRDRAIQAVSQGILITDPNLPDNPIVFASAGFERITGYLAADVVGRNCRFLQGRETDRETVTELRLAVADGRSASVEILNYRVDGTPIWVHLSISPVLGANGRVTHFVGVQADITERRRLELQFRQAQKMEAIGRLAGGVAHDFNNLLTVINGYCELLLARMPAGNPQHDKVTEIQKAGQRATGLTRQLLAFSRQQVLEPKILDLNVVVADTENLLRRLIGEDVSLATRLGTGLGHVKADPGQIEQVLMNLAVNARDAMVDGGILTIETQNVQLDRSYCRAFADLTPGDYVLMAVSDTGCGMDAATQARIFEPFFTTKGLGQGTGLGLATVHGIIKQSRGHIAIYSEIGYGTTFKVYLPHVLGPVSIALVNEAAGIMPKGHETILFVEDDAAVRSLGCSILIACGYEVLTASDGEAALALSGTHVGDIHLLVSDVVMPRLGGGALSKRLAETRPECKVLFLSGYTDDAVIRHGVLDAAIAFLQKPFTPISLAKKIRAVLDGTEQSGHGAP